SFEIKYETWPQVFVYPSDSWAFVSLICDFTVGTFAILGLINKQIKALPMGNIIQLKPLLKYLFG
uniref:hypothetical protein n=1 Tax=Streptococcus agalactiae TaxID=1311 RepID=UPI000A666320